MIYGEDAKSYFSLDPNYVNLNHGSYGATPKFIQKLKYELLEKIESNPDKWIRTERESNYVKSCKAISHFLGVENNANIVLVKNTSTGVTSVVRSLLINHSKESSFYYSKSSLPSAFDFVKKLFSFVKSELFFLKKRKKELFRVLTFSFAYVQVVELLSYFSLNNACDVTFIDVKHPFTPNDLVNSLLRVLNENKKKGNLPFDLAIIDFIVSVPALITPVEELIGLCHSFSVPVLIDAAHVIGQIPFNLDKMNNKPDFFITNAHKWLFSPRGCAVLYVCPKYKNVCVPNVVSHGFKKGSGSLHSKFEWVGTDDDSTYSLLPEIINWRNDFAHGEVKITKYLHILAVWSGLYLSRKWDSEMMFSACRKDSKLSLEELETRLKVWLDLFSTRDGSKIFDASLNEIDTGYEHIIPALVNIRLPKSSASQFIHDAGKSSFLIIFSYGGFSWLRISVNIYNSMKDIEWLETQLNHICKLTK